MNTKLFVLLALCLSAPLLASGRKLAEQDDVPTALDALKEQCNDTFVDYRADNVTCEACMDTVSGTTFIDQAWACGDQLCQDESLWAEDYPAVDDGFDVCTDCLTNYPVQVCQACFANVPSEYPPPDFDTEDVPEARNRCLQCWDEAPGLRDEGMFGHYLWACGVCSNIPEGDERDWCFECISTAKARAEPVGILSIWEVEELAKEGGATFRWNDFGKCAVKANHSYAVRNGYGDPEGIYSSCAWDSKSQFPSLDPGGVSTDDSIFDQGAQPLLDCIKCMEDTQDYVAFDGSQPNSTNKAYACALCRHPDWFNDEDKTEVELLAISADVELCYSCVANESVWDAWGCTNCFKRQYEAESADTPRPFDVEDCVDCMTSNPYEDKVGAYSWACGECAAIAEDAVRELCQQCILQPSLDSDDLAADLLDHEWVGNASEIICSCVDMSKTAGSTWPSFGGDLSDWYTQDCPNCTAMQKQCYLKREIAAGLYPIKFHLDDSIAPVYDAGGNPGTTGDQCAICMREFEAADQSKNMYACEQYCMNPHTIKSEQEFDQCFSCLTAKANQESSGYNDVASCEMCIQKVADADTRSQCMACINYPTSFPDTRDWACGACASIDNFGSRYECFDCLYREDVDPCACVDGIQRGWLYYEIVEDVCIDPALFADATDDGDESVIQGGSQDLGDDFSGDACAKLADEHGADVWGVDGTTCLWSVSNVAWLQETGPVYPGPSTAAACDEGSYTVPVYGPSSLPPAYGIEEPSFPGPFDPIF
mmetsp:Transcript_9516/g.21090  ORF Transcript_9516/g.21090 Transcript_9516/m.21090 type:complete len:767 (+) Transcript_9516:136-2436(+)